MTREEQNQTLQNKIRKLAPDAIDTLGEMMRDAHTPAPTKAQLIGFVLERTLGKPDATIHLTTNTGTRQDSENRLIALANEIRLETTIPPETPENEPEEETLSEDEEEEYDPENNPEE